MTYRNDRQLLQLEEEVFQTALLGLLELEGRRLMRESEQLQRQGLSSPPPPEGVRAVERQIRRHERGGRCLGAWKKAAPILSKVAVWFFVLCIGAGTVVMASADVREILCRLLLDHRPRYTQIQIDPSRQAPPDADAYAAAGAVFAPTYLPAGLTLQELECLRFSIRAYYGDGEAAEPALSLAQLQLTEKGVVRLDTEDADRLEELAIGESLGLLVVKGPVTQISWQMGQTVLLVHTDSLPPEEAVRFAQGIRPL